MCKKFFQMCCIVLILFIQSRLVYAQDSSETLASRVITDAPENQEITVNNDSSVTLHVSGLPIAQVLHWLSIESRQNIIASPAVTGSVNANLFNVSMTEALDAILTSNNAGFIESGNFIYVYTNDELLEMEQQSNPPETKVFRLSYISSEEMAVYVNSIVGDTGMVATSPAPATGIKSEPDKAGGMSNAHQDLIIVTAPPGILRQVEEVINTVDVRPKQVLIEATILRATLRDDNALGIDFTVTGGVDLQMLGATANNGGANLNLGPLPTELLDDLTVNASSDFRGNVQGGGLSFGLIKDQVGVFVRALESVTDTTVLANPKVLVLNKQKGQVIVGRRDGYLTTTVTETQAVQTVEFLETGTTLIFRPFVGDDGFVRIELHPEDSVGLVNAQGLPTEQTTEVTTNVLVKDGHTVLIGGLFRDQTTDAREQIPGLGSIPGVGQLFRSNNDSTSREEVIVLLTVHVVEDHQKYSEISESIMEDIEDIRVGLRRGMMWYSRERLAQSHYQRALSDFASGRDGWAMWNVNLALHNNHRLLPAIRLRHKLLNRKNWSEDGSIERNFIYRVIANEEDSLYSVSDRPVPETVRESTESTNENND